MGPNDPLYLSDEELDLATDEELIGYYQALSELEAESREWRLQPRQLVWEELSSEAFELLAGGAAGPGKSNWALWHMYHHALKYPGFEGLLLRRSFPELRRSLILESWKLFDRTKARYLMGQNVWRFANGSLLEFGYLERDQDVYRYQGGNYDAIGIDELTQFPTDFPWVYLMSRCRTTVAKAAMGVRPHMIATANPGNVGGLWVKTRFVDPSPPNVVFDATIDIIGEAPRIVKRAFGPGRLADNAYIDAGQYRMALANLPDKVRRQLEDGDWDVVEGQYFDEWDRKIHVVAPFTIPEWWTRIGGLDYGFANPFCHLSAAFDDEGRCFVYREHYRTRLTPPLQAQLILEAERATRDRPAEKLAYRVADPSIWAHSGVGPPIADQYRDAGMLVRRANNARIDGWARVREYLRLDPDSHLPRLFIFANCTNLIRTLPALVHDQHRPEDLDTKGEDHAADALRYLLMSRPFTARSPQAAYNPRIPEHRMARRIQRSGKPQGILTPVGRLK